MPGRTLCGGAFTAPAAPVTEWSRPSEGTCVVTVRVSARGKSDAESFTVIVAPAGPAGDASVSGTYLARPRLEWFGLGPCGFSREQPAGATCPTVLGAGTTHAVSLEYTLASETGSRTVGLSDDCAGASVPVASDAAAATFEWTAPAAGGVCVVTAHVTHETMTDSLPMAIQVGCADDAYEENDSLAARRDLGSVSVGAPVDLAAIAGDNDWYGVWLLDGERVVLRAEVPAGAEPVRVELFRMWLSWPDGREGADFVAGGEGTVSAELPNGIVYAVHVAPRSCAPYALRIEIE
jgi:hypothetical protein